MHTTGVLFALSAFAATAYASANQQETPCPTMPPMPTEAPSTDSSDSPAGSCRVLKDHDRLGFDLASVKGTRDSCNSACTKTNGCVTWAWNDYEGGTCWLKSQAGEIFDKAGVWTTTCVVQTSSQSCTALPDIDLVGKDIANKPGKTFGDCCKVCRGFEGCTAYTWSGYNGGTCWLKKNVERMIANPGVISSPLAATDSDKCSFEKDVDFVGNDIGNKPAKNAGECCSICKADKDCKAYSWSKYNDGTCWMKSGKGKTVSAVGVISAKL